MLAHYDNSIRARPPPAQCPYLKLTGMVAGGWQMARAARIARDLIQAGETDGAS